jgi:type II secretory pathway component GspD/PulD (secretin)
MPWLSKIPLLGALFGSQSKNGDSQELCIVITAMKDGTRGHSHDQPE